MPFNGFKTDLVGLPDLEMSTKQGFINGDVFFDLDHDLPNSFTTSSPNPIMGIPSFFYQLFILFNYINISNIFIINNI